MTDLHGAASGPLTLALEASTYDGSVALVRGREVLAEAGVAMRVPGEERLMPAVADVLRRARVVVGDVERVACGAGPGSFTSLRIAAGIAKGIAAGRGVPLVAVSSLLLVVAGSRWGAAPGRYLALLGAMRDEYFAAGYEVTGAGAVVRVLEPALLPAAEVDRAAARIGARPIGPGQELEAAPHARGVAVVGGAHPGVVELSTWEPNYGRLAEAQVRWERTHGRPLPAR
jgi:tRNA threonylcarbamoyladenosine biosynthesis protein TsaB